MRLQGIAVTLNDRHGDSYTVDNVLIGEPGTEDVNNAQSVYGKHIQYVLAVPKGDTHDWEDAYVEFFGQTFKTVGLPTQGIEKLIPLDWNKKIRVERYKTEPVELRLLKIVQGYGYNAAAEITAELTITGALSPDSVRAETNTDYTSHRETLYAELDRAEFETDSYTHAEADSKRYRITAAARGMTKNRVRLTLTREA